MSYAPLPTASDIAVSRAAIADREADIARIDSRITELENEITNLRALAASAQNDIATHLAHIAPIRRLPFEILGEIVTLCATDPDASVQVLRTLASVCKTWRDATLRTPRAWSRIKFAPSYSYNPPTRNSLLTIRDLNEWFERSGTCKKDVSLDITPLTLEDTISALHLVTQHLNELVSLRIIAGYRKSDTGLGDLLRQAMPQLATLDLATFDVAEELGSDFRLDSSNLPRLRTLHARSRIPTAQALQRRVERLFFDRMTISTFNADFNNSSSLCVLSINNLEVNAGGLANLHDVDLPSLRALHLYIIFNPDAVAVPGILHRINAPLLETISLRIESGRLTKTQAAAQLQPLKTASNIRVLHLCGFWLSDAETVQLLSRLPTLERLVLLNAKASDKVVDALGRPKSTRSPWLLPHLTHLYIQCAWSKSDKFQVTANAMVEMAKARLAALQDAANQDIEPPIAALAAVHLSHRELVATESVTDTGLDTIWAWEYVPATWPERGWWAIPNGIKEYEE
ncbi:hypothetical protein EXIGLDRAFT_745621 [Exidia glandulosa HHB12029]|uniref:Uncharacterized protein n=1 Tax=Exidia glandulosa HHB12029 TaxID=1314781 RepID=A0A165N7J1_EXIGL|nr:hypothetical protein EXIGLDRAFT_745621 [Exidia glandulosa HHB12029]